MQQISAAHLQIPAQLLPSQNVLFLLCLPSSFPPSINRREHRHHYSLKKSLPLRLTVATFEMFEQFNVAHLPGH